MVHSLKLTQMPVSKNGDFISSWIAMKHPHHSDTHIPQTMSEAGTNFLTQTEKSLALQTTVNCMAKCIWAQGCQSYSS